jgi:hypothetical protein
MDHFPTESDKKTYVFAYTTNKTIIEAKDDPENEFLN